MTTPKPPKPLTKGGRVVIWFLIVFIALLGVGGGIALIAQGVDGGSALADGPVGTFTPTDRTCGKDGCTLTGEFVGEDGAITRTGVELRGGEKIRRNDPTPSRIDDVRLDDDADRPTAYTNDYNPVPKIAGGALLLVFGLVLVVVLVRMVRRHKRTGQVVETQSAKSIGSRPSTWRTPSAGSAICPARIPANISFSSSATSSGTPSASSSARY